MCARRSSFTLGTSLTPTISNITCDSPVLLAVLNYLCISLVLCRAFSHTEELAACTPSPARSLNQRDNKHQETHIREDNLPTPANLARALEVAEELLQAIKQANPTPTGIRHAVSTKNTGL